MGKSEKSIKEDYKRHITELPTNEYSYHLIDLNEKTDYEAMAKALIRRSEDLLDNIDDILRANEKIITKFTIGKTYAKRSVQGKSVADATNKKHWVVQGIKDRWFNTYKKQKYDFLIAFVILTKNNILDDVPEPFGHQETLALALQSRIIQHFLYTRNDKRIDNRSFQCGRESKGYAGGAIYLAVGYTKNDDDESSGTMGKSAESMKKECEKRITEFPEVKYSYHLIDLKNETNYEKLAKALISRSEGLLAEINDMQGANKIRKFTIGKTYATQSRLAKGHPDATNENHWLVAGIKDRWFTTYRKKEYDRLIAFVILTKKNILYDVPEPFRHQEMLALALESRIIQHFVYTRNDERIDNRSFHGGRESNIYAGGVIYLAVRYTKNDEDESSSDDEVGRQASSAVTSQRRR